jgi:hypothetical protein
MLAVLAAAADPREFQWPTKFDPYTQRAVWTQDGAVILELPQDLKRVLKPSLWDPILRIFLRRPNREQVVGKLVMEGFPVDVPTDGWGWDSVKTMRLRYGYGYVWVPSSLNPAVQLAPGLSSPGLTVYDPASPPLGSILVPPPASLPPLK